MYYDCKSIPWGFPFLHGSAHQRYKQDESNIQLPFQLVGNLLLWVLLLRAAHWRESTPGTKSQSLWAQGLSVKGHHHVRCTQLQHGYTHGMRIVVSTSTVSLSKFCWHNHMSNDSCSWWGEVHSHRGIFLLEVVPPSVQWNTSIAKDTSKLVLF